MDADYLKRNLETACRILGRETVDDMTPGELMIGIEEFGRAMTKAFPRTDPRIGNSIFIPLPPNYIRVKVEHLWAAGEFGQGTVDIKNENGSIRKLVICYDEEDFCWRCKDDPSLLLRKDEFGYCLIQEIE